MSVYIQSAYIPAGIPVFPGRWRNMMGSYNKKIIKLNENDKRVLLLYSKSEYIENNVYNNGVYGISEKLKSGYDYYTEIYSRRPAYNNDSTSGIKKKDSFTDTD